MKKIMDINPFKIQTARWKNAQNLVLKDCVLHVRLATHHIKKLDYIYLALVIVWQFLFLGVCLH